MSSRCASARRWCFHSILAGKFCQFWASSFGWRAVRGTISGVSFNRALVRCVSKQVSTNSGESPSISVAYTWLVTIFNFFQKSALMPGGYQHMWNCHHNVASDSSLVLLHIQRPRSTHMFQLLCGSIHFLRFSNPIPLFTIPSAFNFLFFISPNCLADNPFCFLPKHRSMTFILDLILCQFLWGLLPNFFCLSVLCIFSTIGRGSFLIRLGLEIAKRLDITKAIIEIAKVH